MLEPLLHSGLQVILRLLPVYDSVRCSHLVSTLEIGMHFEPRLLFCLCLLPVLLRTKEASLIS